MRYYELVFAVKPTLTEEQHKAVVEEIKSLITSNGGEIYNEEDWGRKELAYPIQNFKSAHYHLVNYKTENSQLPIKLEGSLRINEDVIRFLNFKTKPKKVEEVPAEV